MTSIPASVQSATVPAALKSTSSGWAAITRIRWISESSSMASSYGRRPITDFRHRNPQTGHDHDAVSDAGCSPATYHGFGQGNRDETDVIMTKSVRSRND